MLNNKILKVVLCADLARVCATIKLDSINTKIKAFFSSSTDAASLSYRVTQNACYIKNNFFKGVLSEVKVKGVQKEIVCSPDFKNITYPINLCFVSTSNNRKKIMQEYMPRVGLFGNRDEVNKFSTAQLGNSAILNYRANSPILFASRKFSTLFFREGKASNLYKAYNNETKNSSFTKTTVERESLKDRLSSKKDRRGITLTTNHRFIALILRWGKRSTSYNIFLNALSQCKHLFDLSNQSAGKSAFGIVNNEENNNIQNFSIKSSFKKSNKSHTIATELNTRRKDGMSIFSRQSRVNKNRGTWGRFQKYLLFFNLNSEETPSAIGTRLCPGSLINKINVEVKRSFSKSFCYNFSQLYTPVQFESMPKRNIFLTRGTQTAVQQLRVKKRLISRRVACKVPTVELDSVELEFALQFIGTEKTEIKNSKPQSVATGSSSLNLSSVDYLPPLLQNENSLHNSDLRNSFLEEKQVRNLFTDSRAAHKILINTPQSSQEQNLVKKRKIALLKKREINADINSKVDLLERITIGINSVNRVSPSVETRKVRIGGATYAVPYVPHNRRQEGVGVRWLIACASLKKQKSKHPLEVCLGNELLDSLKYEGQSTKKRDQSHQTAAANRAYTRYRWW